MTSKIEELQQEVKENRPDIVCITETKLEKEILDTTLNLRGYQVWRRDRRGKKGGGVMILSQDNLIVREVTPETSGAEIVTIEIQLGREKILISTVYAPPHTKSWEKEEHEGILRETLHDLGKIIQKANQKNHRLIMIGDFNCSKVDWRNYEVRGGELDWSWNRELFNLATQNLLYQHIIEPTRMRGEDKPSTLDLLFTRTESEVANIQYRTPLGNSDHVLLQFNFLVHYDVASTKEKHREDRLDYKRGNYQKLREVYRETDWKELGEIEDVNKQYEKFIELYDKGTRQCIPKVKETSQKTPDWFNARCKEAKRKKDLTWKRWNRHRTKPARERFVLARNEYTEIRREEARNFEKDIVERSEKEPKILFAHINRKTKVKNKLQRLSVDGEIHESDKEICEVLNKTFHSVFTKEGPWEGGKGEKTEGVEQLSSVSVSKMEVLKKLKELDKRKAMGPDKVSGWVLRECAEELSQPIATLYENSLKQGKIPYQWKLADIVPIFKKGNREDPLNYRPVSLTSILCKILEKIVRERWVNHLERNKLLSDKQFGFRSKRSCVANLLSFYDRVTEVLQEREGWVDCIYLDLKKAFDKVPHNRLKWKLRTGGGVGGKLLEWMEDFLGGRKMRTVTRGEKSGWREVTSGVPQGSVLAPVMFLVYINDLTEGVTSYMNMFADDAKVQRKITDEESTKALQSDLDKIHGWSQKWQMEFNTSKCSVIHMGESQKREMAAYKLGEEELKKVDKEKDLGVTITKNLDPGEHIGGIVRKAYAWWANLRMAFNYMDLRMAKILITQYIRPSLEYAAVIWNPHQKKDIAKLEKVQRDITRKVPGLQGLTYEERLEKLEITSLEERRVRGDVINMYKCIKGKQFVDKENFVELTQGKTRGHKLKVQKAKGLKDVKKYSFPNRAIDKWNKLPAEVIEASSIGNFKKRYDEQKKRDKDPERTMGL